MRAARGSWYSMLGLELVGMEHCPLTHYVEIANKQTHECIEQEYSNSMRELCVDRYGNYTSRDVSLCGAGGW